MHSEGLSTPGNNTLRAINAGWIFFVFILAEVYGANLTAILTLGPATVQQMKGIQQCMEEGCNFCVQDGAANEQYFRDNFLTLQIVEKENIQAQIEGIMDGSCAAAELTVEDLFKWGSTETNRTRRCAPQVTGLPIVRRQRGMMVRVLVCV